MKNSLLFLTAILVLGLCVSKAQSPAPEPDTLKQVKQTDPEAKTIPRDANYTRDQVKITSTEIPASVRRTLESGAGYAGWERAIIYKNKSGNLYTVEITKGDTTRTYRFDRLGKPVNE